MVCAVYHDKCPADNCLWREKRTWRRKKETAVQTETAMQTETAVQTETAMQTETAVQTETESDQDFQGRESLKLGLFTVYYPEEWKYDKERMQEDDDYSYVRFFDGETADDSGNSIYRHS